MSFIALTYTVACTNAQPHRFDIEVGMDLEPVDILAAVRTIGDTADCRSIQDRTDWSQDQAFEDSCSKTFVKPCPDCGAPANVEIAVEFQGGRTEALITFDGGTTAVALDDPSNAVHDFADNSVSVYLRY